MFESIDAYVAKCIQLTPEEYHLFHKLLHHRKVPKRTMLLRPGEVSNEEAYILKGCIRIYYLDDKGSEVTLSFAIEDWWVGDLASFYQRTPSALFIETLEDCELLTLDYKSKETLYEKVPAFERLFRIMVQRTHVVLQERFVSTVAQQVEERYLAFIKKYPSIPNRVPQHLIASYLGVSPEFLSKVRTRMAHRK